MSRREQEQRGETSKSFVIHKGPAGARLKTLDLGAIPDASSPSLTDQGLTNLVNLVRSTPKVRGNKRYP